VLAVKPSLECEVLDDFVSLRSSRAIIVQEGDELAPDAVSSRR
jgi:hypothetical protein